MRRYLGRLSGPLLDRIDLCVEMGRLSIKEYRLRKPGEKDGEYGSAAMRERVLRARKVQEERFAACSISFNAQMGVNELQDFVRLSKEDQEYMDSVYESLHLSLRSYHRLLKVARTIADLDGRSDVGKEDINEALCYRSVEDRYWG